MALLIKVPKKFETLPDGRTIDEAGRQLIGAGGNDLQQAALNQSPDRQSGVRVAFGPNGLTGIKLPDQPSTLPMAGGVRLPAPIDLEAPSSGLPNYPAPNKPVPSPVNIRIGASTEGLNPLEKSAAVLDTERQAAQNYPSSRVTAEGEVLPPKMHHGLKDKLKSIGKGLVINMGEYARTHPGADLPELLGAGGAGAAVGGISPISIDQQIANAAVQRHESDLNRQIGLEQEQAQLQGIKLKPVLEAEKLRIEREVEAGRISREEAQRQIEQLKATETARHNRETEDIQRNRPRAGERNVVNGTIVEKQPDGSWKAVYESPGKTKPEVDNTTRASWFYKQQHEAETNAVALRKQAEGIVPKEGYDLDKSQAAEKEDLLRRASALENDARDYRVKGDTAATSASRNVQTPSPSTHVLNKQEWLKHHDAADWPKAVTAAKAAGYQIQ